MYNQRAIAVTDMTSEKCYLRQGNPLILTGMTKKDLDFWKAVNYKVKRVKTVKYSHL